MLCKIRHYVPTTELRSIYYAIFSSHMTYGAQIWGQTTTIHNEKITKLQNRAMRIISFSDYRADAEPLYKRNNILKLDAYMDDYSKILCLSMTFSMKTFLIVLVTFKS